MDTLYQHDDTSILIKTLLEFKEMECLNEFNIVKTLNIEGPQQ